MFMQTQSKSCIICYDNGANVYQNRLIWINFRTELIFYIKGIVKKILQGGLTLAKLSASMNIKILIIMQSALLHRKAYYIGYIYVESHIKDMRQAHRKWYTRVKYP